MNWLKKIFKKKKKLSDIDLGPPDKVHVMCPNCGCGTMFPLNFADPVEGKKAVCACGKTYRISDDDVLYYPFLQLEARAVKPCKKFCGGPKI